MASCSAKDRAWRRGDERRRRTRSRLARADSTASLTRPKAERVQQDEVEFEVERVKASAVIGRDGGLLGVQAAIEPHDQQLVGASGKRSDRLGFQGAANEGRLPAHRRCGCG